MIFTKKGKIRKCYRLQKNIEGEVIKSLFYIYIYVNEI